MDITYSLNVLGLLEKPSGELVLYCDNKATIENLSEKDIEALKEFWFVEKGEPMPVFRFFEKGD